MVTTSSADSTPTADSRRANPPQPAKSPRGRHRLIAIGISLAVALAILGVAWFVNGDDGGVPAAPGGANGGLPKVDQPAPDFTALDVTTGKLVHLSDFRGHPVWINFWGSWCPPCRAEAPDIEQAYQEVQPKGVVLLAISVREPPADAEHYAQINHLTYTILSDPAQQGTAAYPVNNFPTHFFIDSHGIIRAEVLSNLDAQSAVQYADQLLQDK